MEEKEAPKIGVNIHTPDYVALAKAYGLKAWQANSITEFSQHLVTASKLNEPCLINIEESGIVAGYPF